MQLINVFLQVRANKNEGHCFNECKGAQWLKMLYSPTYTGHLAALQYVFSLSITPFYRDSLWFASSCVVLLNNTWWQQCSTDRIFSVTAKPTDSYIEGGIGFRRVKSNNQIITHSVSWLLSDTVDMLTYIQEEHWQQYWHPFVIIVVMFNIKMFNINNLLLLFLVQGWK